jgi:hypothetical protein
LIGYVKNEHRAWGNTAGRKQRAAGRRVRLEDRRQVDKLENKKISQTDESPTSPDYWVL